MFDKILIANRGEIACRVIRTAKRLGIATVAVYSDADAGALHVALADEAYRIGPAPARLSYLQSESVVTAAVKSGAQAIHPGYGFLSENADFAEGCAAAGIVFIGPPPAAIRAMGSKSAAKRIMEHAAVPLVPGYHGEEQSLDFLCDAAGRIGYPVVIKASAGGGGKGMRVVWAADTFDDALAAARREALSSFGDDSVLLEKYLINPRHVEIQVFSDSLGNTVHLFERDCSIQRRHQKVTEECPAPRMEPELRTRMGAAAVAAARAIGYLGAGTVEFLLASDGSFYFMEMNTRLQVEHAVTEMVTGQDLVEWQLRVASGEPLPLSQDQLALRGHAIEARIYAEDPDRDFLPCSGTLAHLRTPELDGQVRLDTGVRQGDRIGIEYDPMIAKLIVWDRDREGALRHLRRALTQYQVAGVRSNIEFLGALAAHPAFAAGAIDTGFIERYRADLVREEEAASDQVLAVAALHLLFSRAAEARAAAMLSAEPSSPWHTADGWRLNGENSEVLQFMDGGDFVTVTARRAGDRILLELPGGTVSARGGLGDNGELWCELDGRRFKAAVSCAGAERTVMIGERSHRLALYDPAAAAREEEKGGEALTAPMPGKIVAVLVQPGARVKRGAPLVIMEAMKMEHTIAAPRDGVVQAVSCAAGAVVDGGDELVTVTSDEGE